MGIAYPTPIFCPLDLGTFERVFWDCIYKVSICHLNTHRSNSDYLWPSYYLHLLRKHSMIGKLIRGQFLWLIF